LPAFVLSCITLQDHLANAHDLSDSLKTAVIRDTQMMYHLKDKIEAQIKMDPDKLLLALSTVWPDVEGQDRQLEEWTLSRTTGCVTLTLAMMDEHFREQQVVYNYLHGILLVDGMAIGKLPSDHSTTAVLTELFGQQSLLTTPSRLRGMQYTLCIAPWDHTVHVGFIDGKMVIRACKGTKIWELVPREVFGSPGFFDLPGPLIVNCYHWLDLTDGNTLEIRHKHHLWTSMPQHWKISLFSKVCSRIKHHREVLVDTHSRLFHRAARNQEGLEGRQHIIVYQQHIHPKKVSLIVDLPRLQLSFYVKKGALSCPHYQAAVDFDQNIGTWHGLRSQLVLVNPVTRRRMVLVPFGKFEVEREGDHVLIDIRGAGSFGKFSVNEILRRIDCAPEPRLIYQKAQLHAYTSSCIPDRLTGMTGTEAALHWLGSGMCQPWSPLGELQLEILRSIARLTPRQEYYPEDLKVMKTERWKSSLTTSMQHPAFGEVVARIINKSEALRLFQLQSVSQSTPGTGNTAHSPAEVPSYGDPHLNLRAWMRWQLCHRMAYFTDPLKSRQMCSTFRGTGIPFERAGTLTSVSSPGYSAQGRQLCVPSNSLPCPSPGARR
jgi:hypothetical protein